MANLSNAMAGIYSLEQLADNNTIIHRLHPLVKIITTVVFIFVVISFDRYDLSGLIPFIFFPVILMALSETPYKPLLYRMAVALPFSVFAGAANIFFDRGIAFSLMGIGVSYGAISFASIIFKTLLTVMIVLILIATTSMPDISYQLNRLKVPNVFVMQLTMTYRYLAVLMEEAVNMYRSYILRSPKQKGIRMKDMGIFVGQLILRSMDRAERIYSALKCRGFNGSYSCHASSPVLSGDYIYLVIVCAAVFLLRFMNFSIMMGDLLSR